MSEDYIDKKSLKNLKFLLPTNKYINLYLTSLLFKYITKFPTSRILKIKEWKTYITEIKKPDSEESCFSIDKNSRLLPKRFYFYEIILNEDFTEFCSQLYKVQNDLNSKNSLSKKLMKLRFNDLVTFEANDLSIGKKLFFPSFEISSNKSNYIKKIEFSILSSFHSSKILSICIEPNQNFIDSFNSIIQTNHPRLIIFNFSLFNRSHIYEEYDSSYLLKSNLTKLYDNIYSEIKTLILNNLNGVFSTNKFNHPKLFLYSYTKSDTTSTNNFWQLFNLNTNSTLLLRNEENKFELSTYNDYLFKDSSNFSLFYDSKKICFDSWINSIDEYLYILMNDWNSVFSTTITLKAYLNNIEKDTVKTRNSIYKNKNKSILKKMNKSFIFDRLYFELEQENFKLFIKIPKFLKEIQNSNNPNDLFSNEMNNIKKQFEKLNNLRNKNKEIMIEHTTFNIERRLFWITFISLIFGIASFIGFDNIIEFLVNIWLYFSTLFL